VGEVPVLVGVALGQAVSWLHGSAYVVGDAIEGYGWSGYLLNAWAVSHAETGRIDSFRGVLHAYLVGHLGELIDSYPDAAVVVASLSVTLLILSAAVAGRALAGPWAGGLAAAAVPWTTHAADMARWANAYPVLSATSAAALALACLLNRRPKAWIALATGAAAGLAWAADDRGLAILPVVLLLTASATIGAGRPRWLPLLVLLGLGTRPAMHYGTWSHMAKERSQTEALENQRGVVHRFVRISNNPRLQAACPVEEADYLTRAALGDCALQMVVANAQDRLPKHLPFGGALTALGALLLLLPGRRGRRGSVEGALLLLGSAPFIGFAMLTPLADRYVSQLAMPLALLPAVGALKLVRTLAPAAASAWASAIVAVAVGAWTWKSDPAGRTSPTALTMNHERNAAAEFALELHRSTTPDDALLDCTTDGISLHMLPTIPQAFAEHLQAPVADMRDANVCVDWIAAPPEAPGRRLVVVKRRVSLRMESEGQRKNIEPAQLVEADGRWTLVGTSGDYQTWEFEG